MNYGFFVFLVVLVPIAGAFLLYIVGMFSQRLRNYLAVIFSFFPLLLILRLYPLLEKGQLEYNFDILLDPGISFSLDVTGFMFALIISFIWFLTTIYLGKYIELEDKRNRFYFFYFLTLGGSLGMVMTGDLFSMFIFFELMSLSAYGLIVHEEDRVAIKAANKYLLLTIVGALLILMGIIFIYHYSGTLSLDSPLVLEASQGVEYIILLLFLAGFGIKAGMFPLHIWLPDAHPAAPTPASALLSGVMIKLGVYGLVRILYLLSVSGNWFASIIMVLGMLGILTGGILALFQHSMKRILAYSSISQIGYIILVLGVWSLGELNEGIALTAGLNHIINHALFKSALFLLVGIIYFKTQELSIYENRGLFYKLPGLTIVLLVAGLSLLGFPGTGGFTSKILLHEALGEGAAGGELLFYFAEKTFKLGGVLTTAYFIKLVLPFFRSPISAGIKKMQSGSLWKMKAGSGLLVLLIVLIGFFPGPVFKLLVVPVGEQLSAGGGFSPGMVNRLYNFKNVVSALLTATGGCLLYLILQKSGLLKLEISKENKNRYSLENLFFRPLLKVVYFVSEVFVNLFDKMLTEGYEVIPYFLNRIDSRQSHPGEFEKEEKRGEPKFEIQQFICYLKEKCNPKEIKKTSQYDFNSVYLDVKNLDFALFLLMIVLLLFLVFLIL